MIAALYITSCYVEIPLPRLVSVKIIKVEQFPDRLKQFIMDSRWTFAKTYASTWPHEYIVQENGDSDLFVEFAHRIDTYGYTSNFYQTPLIYLDYEGRTY